MKSLLLFLLLSLGLSTLSHAQGITGILGGGSESPVFTGVCGTGFNLVIESTTGTAVAAATATTLAVVTDENAQIGRVYTVAQDNGANNMRLVTFTNLDTTPVIQNNIVLAAATSPDSQGALGVHLNTRGTISKSSFRTNSRSVLA